MEPDGIFECLHDKNLRIKKRQHEGEEQSLGVFTNGRFLFFLGLSAWRAVCRLSVDLSGRQSLPTRGADVFPLAIPATPLPSPLRLTLAHLQQRQETPLGEFLPAQPVSSGVFLLSVSLAAFVYGVYIPTIAFGGDIFAQCLHSFPRDHSTSRWRPGTATSNILARNEGTHFFCTSFASTRIGVIGVDDQGQGIDHIAINADINPY